MRRLQSSIALLLVLAVVGGNSPSFAQAPPEDPRRTEEARGRFNRGVELYQEGDYRGALAEFRRAYEIVPSWRIFYNIAQACAEVQDYACALRSFDQYLAQGGAELPPERRAQVEADVKKLRARIARVRVRANRPDAEIFVDETSFGRSPLAEPALVGAGRRRISATLPSGQTVAKVIEVAGGDAVEVELSFGEVPTAAAPKPAPSRAAEPPSRAPIYAGLAVTGALAAAATVTGVLSLGAKSDLDAELDKVPGTRGDIDDARSRARTLALATDVLAGAAVVAAGVTVVLVLVRPSAREAAVRLEIGPGSAGLRGRF